MKSALGAAGFSILGLTVFCVTGPLVQNPDRSCLGFYVDETSGEGRVSLLLDASAETPHDIVAEWRFDGQRDWIPLQGSLRDRRLVLEAAPGRALLTGRFEGDTLIGELHLDSITRKDGHAVLRIDERVRVRALNALNRPYLSTPPNAVAFETLTRIRLKKVADLSNSCLRQRDLTVRCSHPLLVSGPPALKEAVRIAQQGAEARSRKEYEEDREGLEEMPQAVRPWEYTESWSLSGWGDRVVSLRCFGSSYTGGNRAQWVFTGRTFWMEGDEAREARFADLFNPCSPWQGEISARILTQLRAAGASDVVSGSITFLDEDQLTYWALTPTGIEFFFPTYWVGCGAEGIFTAFVNYGEIAELLHPLGPVSGFRR